MEKQKNLSIFITGCTIILQASAAGPINKNKKCSGRRD
jgi:hypothetical protein